MALSTDTGTDTHGSPERSPWASPDPRPRGAGTTFGAAPAAAGHGTPLWHDVRAGLLTVAVTVLVGAPVGLLWAALAPRVTVEISGEQVQAAGAADGFIAVDAWFFAAVVLAGLVGGVLAWWLGGDDHAHGPAVVLGLVAGGLAAAWIAGRVGGEVDRVTVEQLVASGAQGPRELAVRLRSTSALLGWPIASLLAYLALSVARRPTASSD